jgi:TonB-linked SusC/RagA family outer membrane protein
MRVSLKQLFLAILFVGVSIAGSLPAQDLVNSRVSVSAKSVSLSKILSEIEKKVNVKFTYQSQLLPENEVYSVNYKNSSLSNALQDLLAPLGIQYQLIGRQVVLTRSAEIQASASTSLQAPIDVKVSGVVTDEKGAGLPGVSILVRGTQKGTVSNADGSFSIDVQNGDAVLIFSFVGYLSSEERVGNRTQLQISLQPDEKALDEVVVTALGVQRKSRALGYSVGEVKNEELTRVPQENIVNSLNGRVSGVRVINTSPDLNSDPMVLIRGYTSLSGGNSPLIVVDGLPTGTDISVMSDLSADNIESVSVLKGPSAAALYGSRAGSGVLLITTKNGNKAKKGIGVRVNSAYTATLPYRFTPVQQRFVNGSNGNFDQTNNLWWGPEMGTSVARFGTNGVATPLEAHPDNIKNFANVGNSYVNDIIVSNSSDKLSFSLSLSDTRGTGVYPGSEIRKDAIALSATYAINNKVSVSANFNYLNSGSDNFRGLSYDNYPYEDLYFTPNWLNLEDLRDYWDEENVKQSVWSNGFNNPWFTVNENINSFRKVRPYGNVKLDWQITNDLSLMTRIGGFNESYTTTDRVALSEKKLPNGGYGYIARNAQEVNTDFLLNYKKGFGEFTFDVSGGGNLLFQNNSVGSITGQRFVLPGLYTASNIDRSAVAYSHTLAEKRINSLYGMASFGFREAVFLEVSGRNDWSSTLPVNNRSYFYPSASLSVVVSDLVKLPEQISLFKLRGGWAKVGKDTSPYQLAMTLARSTWGDQTTYSLPAKTPTSNLLPESIISSELGFDLNMFKRRLGLNFTYYEIANKNQITGISVSGATGFTAANVNAGVVQNKGVEISLRTVALESKNVNWDFVFNFTKERSRLTSLPEGVSNHQFWSRQNVFSQTRLGGVVGDLWGPDVVRVEDGPYKDWPILNQNGYVQLNTNHMHLGNVMPDFTVGIQSNLQVKRFTFSASFDWRKGGDYYSESMVRLSRDGRQESWYKGDGSSTFSGILNSKSFGGDRDKIAEEIANNPAKYNAKNGLTYVGGRNADLGGFEYGGNIANGVFFPGVILGSNGEYIENFGAEGTKIFRSDLIADPGSGYWSRGVQTWIYDASFLKLREFAVAYAMPDALVKHIGAGSASLSLFARNIILWTKAKNNIDPESTMMNGNSQFSSTPNYLLGFDRASFYPWTMSAGVKLNIQF